MSTDVILYGAAADTLTNDGFQAVERYADSDLSGCCSDPLCTTAVTHACTFLSLLPNGPLWDGERCRVQEAIQANGGLPDGTDDIFACPSLVTYAVYLSSVLNDTVENIITPSVRESSVHTAVDTLDDWLLRFNWVDCYRGSCSSQYERLFSPYLNTDPQACEGELCEDPATFWDDDFDRALKHALVVSLDRASRGVIKNLDGINWVIEPLGAVASVPAVLPVAVQDYLDGNVDACGNDLTATTDTLATAFIVDSSFFSTSIASALTANDNNNDGNVGTPMDHFLERITDWAAALPATSDAAPVLVLSSETIGTPVASVQIDTTVGALKALTTEALRQAFFGGFVQQSPFSFSIDPATALNEVTAWYPGTGATSAQILMLSASDGAFASSTNIAAAVGAARALPATINVVVSDGVIPDPVLIVEVDFTIETSTAAVPVDLTTILDEPFAATTTVQTGVDCDEVPCFCDHAQLTVTNIGDTLPAAPTVGTFCERDTRGTVPAVQDYACQTGDPVVQIYPAVIAAECIIRSMLVRHCPNLIVGDRP